jgi:hypothetical protein
MPRSLAVKPQHPVETIMPTNELQEIDRQLLGLHFDRRNLMEIENLLARRNGLVEELAVELRRSLAAGAEVTRKLAEYRSSLNADLLRSSHVALHQYVADDIPGDPS